MFTSSFRLLTNKTVARAKPGVTKPLDPGAVCPKENPPKPGNAPATALRYGFNGDCKPCKKALGKAPGVPARRESAQLQIDLVKKNSISLSLK